MKYFFESNICHTFPMWDKESSGKQKPVLEFSLQSQGKHGLGALGETPDGRKYPTLHFSQFIPAVLSCKTNNY